MIKYFDFEKSIEEVDSKIEFLEKKNDESEYNLIGGYKKEKIIEDQNDHNS